MGHTRAAFSCTPVCHVVQNDLDRAVEHYQADGSAPALNNCGIIRYKQVQWGWILGVLDCWTWAIAADG